MNEKLSKVIDILKRVWDKVAAFMKVLWVFIIKAYRFIAPKAVSAARFVWKKTLAFLNAFALELPCALMTGFAAPRRGAPPCSV